MFELRWVIKDNHERKNLQYRQSVKRREYSGIGPHPETVEIEEMTEWKDVPIFVEKRVIDRQQVNLYLKALLGKDELVEKWWLSKNKKFDMRTPEEVFNESNHGKECVINYVLAHCYG